MGRRVEVAATRALHLLGVALRRATILALPLVAPGCIEERLSVEIFTQVNGDGSCTRRVEYRLERVDKDRGGARVAIDPKEDPLRVAHRFPSGEPWQVRDEAELGLHVVKVFVPGAVPLHPDHRYPWLGHRRLYDVPVSLGWRGDRAAPEELNPMPHPFA